MHIDSDLLTGRVWLVPAFIQVESRPSGGVTAAAAAANAEPASLSASETAARSSRAVASEGVTVP